MFGPRYGMTEFSTLSTGILSCASVIRHKSKLWEGRKGGNSTAHCILVTLDVSRVHSSSLPFTKHRKVVCLPGTCEVTCMYMCGCALCVSLGLLGPPSLRPLWGHIRLNNPSCCWGCGLKGNILLVGWLVQLGRALVAWFILKRGKSRIHKNVLVIPAFIPLF
jgi:hypothetical protein